MKRVLRIAICLVLVLSLIGTVVAYAQTESNAYISSFGGAVSVANDGTVTVNFGTHGTDLMDKIGASAISIYENGTHRKTFFYTNPLYTATMMGTNDYDFYGYVTYAGTKGNTYQALITHYAEKDGGSGMESMWTDIAS